MFVHWIFNSYQDSHCEIFFKFFSRREGSLWFLESGDTRFCLILGQNLTWRVGNWLNSTLEHTAVSPGMLPTPDPCFLCSTSCSFLCLPTSPWAARLSFLFFPKSGVSLHLARLQLCQNTTGLPRDPGSCLLLGRFKIQWCRQVSLSLLLSHSLSYPVLCLRTLLEVAAKPLSILPELSPSCSWWLKAGSGWKDGAAGEVTRLWNQLCLDINALCFLPLDSSLLWTSWSSWGTWRASQDWHSG